MASSGDQRARVDPRRVFHAPGLKHVHAIKRERRGKQRTLELFPRQFKQARLGFLALHAEQAFGAADVAVDRALGGRHRHRGMASGLEADGAPSLNPLRGQPLQADGVNLLQPFGIAPGAVIVAGTTAFDAERLGDDGLEAVLIVQKGARPQLPGRVDGGEVFPHGERSPRRPLGRLELGNRRIQTVPAQEGGNVASLDGGGVAIGRAKVEPSFFTAVKQPDLPFRNQMGFPVPHVRPLFEASPPESGVGLGEALLSGCCPVWSVRNRFLLFTSRWHKNPYSIGLCLCITNLREFK